MPTSQQQLSMVISDWRVAPFRVNGETIFAIGDVHGCADHLSLLIQTLEAEAQRVHTSRLIFLGDLICRGPSSLGALTQWSGRHLDSSFKHVDRLCGNHEQLLMLSIGDGNLAGAARTKWMSIDGGTFVDELRKITGRGDAPLARDLLQEAAGDTIVNRLNQLQSHVWIGNSIFVHGGIDPSVDPKTCLAEPWTTFGAVFMDHIDLVIVGRILGALAAGAMIGFERTFHGRPAGFRTHALVCISSAALMMVTVYQQEWMIVVQHDAIRTDPTRMAQGIMTGIGFLGAGVIFKEGLTVRGLTTAASIWITAAIGILIGIGFWFAALVSAAATLMILSAFRFIESWLPSEFCAHHVLRFARDKAMSADGLRTLVGKFGFSIANLSSRLIEGGQHFEYRMTMKSRDRSNADSLSKHLRDLPEVVEFRIAPTGD